MNDLSAFDGDAERDRQIVDLRVKGKSEAEVCQILGCTVTFTGRYGDWRDERDREGHFHLIRACFIEATATFASL
jgi:hypothetical protein